MDNHIYFHLDESYGKKKTTLPILGKWSYAISGNDLLIKSKIGPILSVSTLANFVGSTGIRNILSGDIGIGVSGPTGVVGPTGVNGDSVQGMTGPTGIAGVGIQGPTGASGSGKGATGVAGPTGVTGAGVQGPTGVFRMPAPVSTLTNNLVIPGFPSNSQIIYVTGPSTLVSTVRVPSNVSMLKVTNIAGGATGGNEKELGGGAGGTVIFTTLCTPGEYISCIMGNYGVYSNYGDDALKASIVSYSSIISYAFYPDIKGLEIGGNGYCTSGHAYILKGSDSYSNGYHTNETGSGLLGGVGLPLKPETTIYWSSNGINWSNANSGGFNGDSGMGMSITYGNGLWVTAGANYDTILQSSSTEGTILYSRDGSNWSNNVSGGFNGGIGIAYGNGLWVAVGRPDTYTSSIQYSRDGSNWSNTNNSIFIDYRGITYANNLWIAYGAPTVTLETSIVWSSNGSNWSAAISGGFSLSINNITYGNGLWVACANAESAVSTIQWSTDGSNWSNAVSGGFKSETYAETFKGDGGPIEIPRRASGNHVAYGNSLWVACGVADSPVSTIQWSTDGSNWSNVVSGGFSEYGNHVAYGNGLWVACGVADSPVSTIQWSINGSNWYAANYGGFKNPGEISEGTKVTYANSMWVAIGVSDSISTTGLLYSFDGSNWSNTNISEIEYVNGNKYYSEVKYNNGLWTAVGQPNIIIKGGGMGGSSALGYGGGGAGGSYFDPNGYPGGYGAGGGNGCTGGQGGAGGPALVVLEFM